MDNNTTATPNEYGCDVIGHDTFFAENQSSHCPQCGMDITSTIDEEVAS